MTIHLMRSQQSQSNCVDVHHTYNIERKIKRKSRLYYFFQWIYLSRIQIDVGELAALSNTRSNLSRSFKLETRQTVKQVGQFSKH